MNIHTFRKVENNVKEFTLFVNWGVSCTVFFYTNKETDENKAGT